MLNRLSDLVRLRTFAGTQVWPVSRVNMEALSDLMPGDTVRAQVEAALPDGTFSVAVRQQPLVLRLPFEARAGDTLQLTVVTREPQLKFALAAQPDHPDLTADLSETARFITALLGESEKLPLASVARTGTPLLAGFPGDSAQIATALRDALAHSGIFYEAHLEQWAAGGRGLATLRPEPQARLKPLPARHAPAAAENAEDAALSTAGGTDVTPQLPQLPVHRDALAMIKQQLDTLETRHIAWHGLIWHGQPLDWEVTEERPDTPQSTAAPPWRTRLRLTLPRLGRIDATLLVEGRGVTIMLDAATAQTAAALADRRATLQQSLHDAGVTPLGISVRRDESA